MGAVSQLLAKHEVEVRHGHVDIHQDQGILESWNRTLAERLFGHQYAQEMSLPSGQRSTEWVAWLPSIVAALNGEVTRLTGKKPSDAIKAKTVAQKPYSIVPNRPVGLKEQRLPLGVDDRYLTSLVSWRAVGAAWLTPCGLKVYQLGRSVTKPNEPVLYYLQDGPPHGFVREELLVVPPDTQLPPELKGWAVHRCTHPSQQCQPEGRLCARRPACPPHFQLSSAWSRRVRARPYSGAARRRDGGRTAGQPCHGGRFAFRREPLYTAHVRCTFPWHAFSLCLLDVSPASFKDWVYLRVQTYKIGDGAPCTLVLHLPQHLLVGGAV